MVTPSQPMCHIARWICKCFCRSKLKLLFCCLMRDLVPRKAPERKTMTPWTTYVHAAPCIHKTPTKAPKKRQSVSPSPVPHSKSPVVFSPVGEERDTPSLIECPHESTQLPKRTVGTSTRAGTKGAIDVIEEFIADLDAEAKEAVRATYNGADWPGRWKPSIPRASNYSRMSISNQSYLLPPVTSFVPNRFLVGLPVSPQVIYNSPVYQYFPRGV